MIMSVGATIVSLLVAVQKSRCTRIKCCGSSCERDIIKQSDIENQLESTRESNVSSIPSPPLIPSPNITPPNVSVASRIKQFDTQSNV